MPSKSRRGVGAVITVVVVVLTILWCVLMARHAFGSAVLDTVSADLLGQLALDTARSAVEETAASLALAVNDPRTDVYRRIRDAACAGGRELALPVETGAVNATLAAPGIHAGHGLAITSASAVLTDYRPLLERPEDGTGTVMYDVTVQVRGARNVVRRYRARQDLRLTALALPAPFDQRGVVIRDPERMLGSHRLNQDVRRVEMELIDDLMSIVPMFHRRLVRAGGAGRLDAAMERLSDVPRVRKVQSEGRRIARFEFPMTALSRMLDKPLNGSAIDLIGELERLRRLAAEKIAAGERLEHKGQLDAAVDVYAEATDAACAHQELVFAWQQRFDRLAGPERQALESRWLELEPRTLRRRAFLCITATAAAPARRQIDEILARQGSLCGVVWIESNGQVVDLRDLEVRGRLVFAISGDADLRDLRPASDRDRVTVIAYGRTTLSGAVRADIAALGSLGVDGKGELTGALVLGNPRPGSLDGLTLVPAPAGAPASVPLWIGLGTQREVVEVERALPRVR